MTLPKEKIWIDARHEKLQPGRREEITYFIPYLSSTAVWEAVYYSLAALVWEIQVPVPGQDLIKVIYDPERITPSFIDYLLEQKGIEFQRLHK
ncbi:MAG: hypothetical protein GX039_00935 [Clostridia bacterium]|nr:hypothetical protein [Clostridia bacterium]